MTIEPVLTLVIIENVLRIVHLPVFFHNFCIQNTLFLPVYVTISHVVLLFFTFMTTTHVCFSNNTNIYDTLLDSKCVFILYLLHIFASLICVIMQWLCVTTELPAV